MHLGLSEPYCHSLDLPNPGKTLIRCGFGCDPNFQLPIRFPAYILPVMELWRSLNEQGIDVTVEFYFAQNFSARLLKNEDKVSKWTSEAECYLNVFLFDRSMLRGRGGYEYTRYMRDRLITAAEWEVLGELVECLLTHASDEVRQFAAKRGGQTALEYMAAHAWYMNDPLMALRNLDSLTPRGTKTWDTIIMVGGAAERVFYDARQTLMRHLPTHHDWNCLQVFTDIGARPTYHLTEGEFSVKAALELSLDQLLARMVRQPKRDMLRLLADCGCDFSGELLNPGNPKQRMVLEWGWKNLQDIIRDNDLTRGA